METMQTWEWIIQNGLVLVIMYYYRYMSDFYTENMAVDLINRTTTDYLEYRDGAYYYKERRNHG